MRNKEVKITIFIILAGLLFALCMMFFSCSSKHYFSINADVMENPSILYQDSTDLQNPF